MTVLRVIAILVLALCAPATSQASAIAISLGRLKVAADSGSTVPAATGSTCVYAEAAGAVAGPGAHGTANAGLVAPVSCTLGFKDPPFKALGVLPGTGLLFIPKFPAPFGTGEAAFSSRLIRFGGVTSSATADWTAGEGTDLTGLITAREASLSGRASVTGAPGLAVAKSSDPWFFSPTEDTTLHLSITLQDVLLETIAGPGETAAAQFETFAAFGLGSTPGQNELRNWPFSKAISGTDTFTLGSPIVLVDEMFPLTKDTTYWLTAEVRSGAQTAVPEPGTILLVGVGLAGLVTRIRGRFRREVHRAVA